MLSAERPQWHGPGAASSVARALLPKSCKNNPLVGALSHAPPSRGLLHGGAALTSASAAGVVPSLIHARGAKPGGGGGGGSGGAKASSSSHVGSSPARPSSPSSVCSGTSTDSDRSFASADHEYGGIASWASRMGQFMDTREDHLDTWCVGYKSD